MTIAQYEHLRIEGSEAFIAGIRAALDLLRPLPSWRYIQGLKRIADSPSYNMYYHERTRTCFIPEYSVLTSIGNDGADYVAGQLVHEGAHSLEPTQRVYSRQDLYNSEVFAFSAQLQSHHEMNSSSSLIAHVENLLKNPLGHYSEGAIRSLISNGNGAVVRFLIAIWLMLVGAGGIALFWFAVSMSAYR